MMSNSFSSLVTWSVTSVWLVEAMMANLTTPQKENIGGQKALELALATQSNFLVKKGMGWIWKTLLGPIETSPEIHTGTPTLKPYMMLSLTRAVAEIEGFHGEDMDVESVIRSTRLNTKKPDILLP